MTGALPYVGYSPLRKGRIHMYCPGCGRKQSNMPRVAGPIPDPTSAVLVQVYCEKCSQGGKGCDQTFMDARGREVCGYCGSVCCDKVGGRRRCTEKLLDSEEPKP